MRRVDNLTNFMSRLPSNLETSNFWTPQRPVQAHNGIALLILTRTSDRIFPSQLNLISISPFVSTVVIALQPKTIPESRSLLFSFPD